MNAGIELGGTKTVVAIGCADGVVHEEWRFPTTSPEETLGRLISWLQERGTPTAIGVGAFGPLGVTPGRKDHGTLLATPKRGWAGFSITHALSKSFPQARVFIETDVSAAALAEARLGAAKDHDDVAYITVGTGIGAGILSDGRLIRGALHPEFGHIKVARQPGDHFVGVCPFHADCLEGLASGPSIAERWGIPAADLLPDHPAWDTEAWYLAQGALSLLGIVSPARIIIGGGVSQSVGLHQKVETLLQEFASDYFTPLQNSPYIVAPSLGQQAGIIGSLLLTSQSK